MTEIESKRHTQAIAQSSLLLTCFPKTFGNSSAPHHLNVPFDAVGARAVSPFGVDFLERRTPEKDARFSARDHGVETPSILVTPWRHKMQWFLDGETGTTHSLAGAPFSESALKLFEQQTNFNTLATSAIGYLFHRFSHIGIFLQ